MCLFVPAWVLRPERCCTERIWGEGREQSPLVCPSEHCVLDAGTSLVGIFSRLQHGLCGCYLLHLLRNIWLIVRHEHQPHSGRWHGAGSGQCSRYTHPQWDERREHVLDVALLRVLRRHVHHVDASHVWLLGPWLQVLPCLPSVGTCLSNELLCGCDFTPACLVSGGLRRSADVA